MGWIWRGGESGEDLQAGYLFPWPLSIPRKYQLVLEAEIIEGGPCDPFFDGGQRRRANHHRRSVTELRMRLGIGLIGMETKVKISS